uniref:Uncharacterized protein n=1 Tax=Ananas comosus var. bracteatus TaxID=296719 RepID=A0A6V7Q8W4_ANACO|nr:unnamed protein product [Ananas comosus var. bracteatus]
MRVPSGSGSGAWRGGAEKVGCGSSNGVGGGSGVGGHRGIVWDVGPWQRRQRSAPRRSGEAQAAPGRDTLLEPSPSRLRLTRVEDGTHLRCAAAAVAASRLHYRLSLASEDARLSPYAIPVAADPGRSKHGLGLACAGRACPISAAGEWEHQAPLGLRTQPRRPARWRAADSRAKLPAPFPWAKTRFQGTTGLFIDLPLRSVVVIARLAIFSGFGGPRSADWNRRLEPLITACGCHVFEQTRLISPGAFFCAPGPAFQILNMDMNSVCQLSAPDWSNNCPLGSFRSDASVAGAIFNFLLPKAGLIRGVFLGPIKFKLSDEICSDS